jgi:hypothetical protein
MRLLIDENFDQRILRGLKLRLPQLDYLIVQQIGLAVSTIRRCSTGPPTKVGSSSPMMSTPSPSTPTRG